MFKEVVSTMGRAPTVGSSTNTHCPEKSEGFCLPVGFDVAGIKEGGCGSKAVSLGHPFIPHRSLTIFTSWLCSIFSGNRLQHCYNLILTQNRNYSFVIGGIKKKQKGKKENNSPLNLVV